MKLHQNYIDMIRHEFGEECYEKLIETYQKDPVVRGLKSNKFKPQKVAFEGYPSRLNPSILIPASYKEAVVHPFHHAGCYYIQDPSATLPVVALGVDTDDVVLDMCAAPGGKSTQILNALEHGFLISNEADYTRALKLKGNIERWGVENCIVVNHKGQELPKYFENTFDKVLLDAPCSGEGLYRKQPEHAQKYAMKTIMEFVALQKELLEAAYMCCVDGGSIVYSTCTMNPYENEEVILDFLEKHPRCRLESTDLKHGTAAIRGLGEKATRFFPSKDGEGHFVAKLKIVKEEARNLLKFEKAKSKSIELNGVVFEGTVKKEKEYLRILKHRGFLNTEAHIVMDGLEFAHEKKNHVEFLHALAMSLEYASVLEKHEATSEEAYKYLYGNTLETAHRGYTVLTYKGHALGLMKGNNNKYPKGLRNKFEKY